MTNDSAKNTRHLRAKPAPTKTSAGETKIDKGLPGRKAPPSPSPRERQTGSVQRPASRRRPASRPQDAGKTGAPSSLSGAKTVIPTKEIISPQEAPPAPPAPRALELPETITVRDLAALMQRSPIEVIKHLMSGGIMANINQVIDYDTAAIVAEELGFEARPESKPIPEEKEEEKPAEVAPQRVYTEEEMKHLAPRPPVVTVMGHVDHGKTKLLDAIRQTNVAAGEAGGITQRIGAYQVEKQGRKITFLDTPGHEAFTAMRARGAKVTDMAILVVAADDGVMPQTLEAINHARAAHVPIIVAINKIDKENANPDLVKQQLSDAGLVVEDWGGDVISVEVSAKEKIGIDTLLDMILLVADMAELRALPDVPAKGTVIEAGLDRTKGPTATLLVQEGTLKLGDNIVIGGIYGKVRALFNDRMERVKVAPPSTPVVILGLPDVPVAGDTFEVVADDKVARALASEHAAQAPTETVKVAKALTLEQVYAQIQAGATKELTLILKTDIQGSIEPIVNSLEKLSADEVKVNIIHKGTGDVSESDVMLAAASKAIIIGFNVGVAPAAAKRAEAEGISIRLYDIIYTLVEDIDKALKGLLEPEYKEVVIGHGRVIATFKVSRLGTIAGAQISDGKALRNSSVRVMRGDQKLYEGKIASLKRFAEDVREVTVGLECGIRVEGFNDFQVGDLLEFYTSEQVSPTS